ncbi:MAG: nucleotidyltransferase domain-containing protein [Egibacteraceae bacterium]
MAVPNPGSIDGPQARGQRRQALLESEARRLTALLAAENAQLVLAFGSFARGTVGPRSDLDLLVVLDTEEPFIARLTRLHELLRPRVALDLVAYTPAELQAVRHRPFIRQALEEGIVLHAS